MELTYRELAQLLQRAADGDQEAFADFYRETVQAQRYQALTYLQDEDLAAEAVQEVYATLLLKLPELKNPRGAVAFLNKTTYFVCQNIRREQQRRSHRQSELREGLMDVSPAGRVEEAYQKKEQTAALQQALQALPARQRAAVAMRYLRRMSSRETAEALKISEATLRRDLAAAKKALREKLKGQIPALVPLGLCLRRGMRPEIGAVSFKPLQVGRAVALAGVGTVFAATLLAGSQLLPHIADAGWLVEEGRTARIEARIEGAPKSVRLVGTEGEVPVALDGDKLLARVEKNGVYTLRVDWGIRREARGLAVTGIDEEGPTLAACEERGGLISVRLEDGGAGVNWERVRLCREDGEELSCRQLDRQAGEVLYALSPGRYQLEAWDLAGNRSQGPLEVR